MNSVPYIDIESLKTDLQPYPTDGTLTYSQHVLVDRVLGSDGRCQWFEGRCPHCHETHIAKRGEKSKIDYDCRSCGDRFFVYRGYFDLARFELSPPTSDDVMGELWTGVLQYDSTEPKRFYGRKEYLEAKVNDKLWNVVEEPSKVEQ